MRNNENRQRGAFTVEAALVFPIILLTILGMFYMSIVKYQSVVTAASAMRTAARTSAYWGALGRGAQWDPETGLLSSRDYTQHDPYRFLIDGNKTARLQSATAYMNWQMSGNPRLLGEEYELTGSPQVDKTGGFFQQYVTVTVDKTFLNPIGSLTQVIGIAPKTVKTITAKAPLNNPGEFVRNVSFIYDLFQ